MSGIGFAKQRFDHAAVCFEGFESAHIAHDGGEELKDMPGDEPALVGGVGVEGIGEDRLEGILDETPDSLGQIGRDVGLFACASGTDEAMLLLEEEGGCHGLSAGGAVVFVWQKAETLAQASFEPGKRQRGKGSVDRHGGPGLQRGGEDARQPGVLREHAGDSFDRGACAHVEVEIGGKVRKGLDAAGFVEPGHLLPVWRNGKLAGREELQTIWKLFLRCFVV